MVIYKFPRGSSDKEGDSGNPDKQFEGKAPDFIYVDEDRIQGGEGRFHSKEGQSRSPLEKVKYPTFLRVLTFVVAAALTVWLVLLSVVFLIVAFIAALTLFQAPSALRLMARVWKWICHISAYALALYVATLSPSFGLGILLVYGTQHQDAWGKETFERFFT